MEILPKFATLPFTGTHRFHSRYVLVAFVGIWPSAILRSFARNRRQVRRRSLALSRIGARSRQSHQVLEGSIDS